jgi:hypothetical protein
LVDTYDLIAGKMIASSSGSGIWKVADLGMLGAAFTRAWRLSGGHLETR